MKKLCILLFCLCAGTLKAQSLSDTVSLRAFMDGVIETHLKDEHIAGASLAIIHQGKVVIAKGYGFADIEKRRPVSADTTLFRIGSISKLFVWTSVMQLVAQGKIDLDKDINVYLKDFKIPDQFKQPVTMRHLMTHTAGFEDKVIGLFAKDTTKLQPLGKILKEQLPERVRPPFIHASYSNHGTAIAAYVVEQISGLRFDEYVEKNILIPLSMQFTTLRQPLPAILKNDISEGYQYVNNEFKKRSFEYVPLYPVGAASASAKDMTHLMRMYLENGKFQNLQVLDSAILVKMMQPAHQHHPLVNPMRYGFMDLSQNGTTVLGHGGDTFWFHSLLVFMPHSQTGFFLSFNTDTGGGVYLKVFEQFMKRYFPDTTNLKPRIAVKKEWLQQFAGEYKSNRYPHHDMTKIISLIDRVQINLRGSDKIEVKTAKQTKVYVPIDSTTFREEFSNDRIAFAKDEKGKTRYLFLGNLPIFVLEKVEITESSFVQNQLFIWIGVFILTALIYWPLVSRLRRHYQPHLSAKSRLPIMCRTIAWINYFLLFIFFIGMTIALNDPQEIVYGVPPLLKGLLVIPFIMMITTLLMGLYFIQIVRDSRYRFWSRLYYLVLFLTSVVALWQLYYWNFIGWKY